MILRTILAAALAAFAGPAAAQSWGFGIEFGGPRYYGAPPGYYGPPPDPYAPPRSVYRPEPVFEMIPPDEIFDLLEDAGYREFSPMAQRGNFYKLNAVNPRGDLVALEVDVLTGTIERERVLAARQRPPRTFAAPRQPQRRAAPPVEAPEPPRAESGDPLVVY